MGPTSLLRSRARQSNRERGHGAQTVPTFLDMHFLPPAPFFSCVLMQAGRLTASSQGLPWSGKS